MSVFSTKPKVKNVRKFLLSIEVRYVTGVTATPGFNFFLVNLFLIELQFSQELVEISGGIPFKTQGLEMTHNSVTNLGWLDVARIAR